LATKRSVVQNKTRMHSVKTLAWNLKFFWSTPSAAWGIRAQRELIRTVWKGHDRKHTICPGKRVTHKTKFATVAAFLAGDQALINKRRQVW